MIVVNSPETYRAIYSQLRHGEWNQWTCTGLIFPFFLFVVGVSSVFSIARRKGRGDGNAQIEAFFLKRFFILFGIGLFMSGYPIFHLSTLRIPVLCRALHAPDVPRGVAHVEEALVCESVKASQNTALVWREAIRGGSQKPRGV